jgi:hypothetical protein
MPVETPPKKVGRGYARNTNAGVLQPMVDSFEFHLRAEPLPPRPAPPATTLHRARPAPLPRRVPAKCGRCHPPHG